MAYRRQEQPAQERSGPSVAALLGHIAEETGRLIRSEAAIIKLELEESTRVIVIEAIKTALYSGIVLLGLLSLLAFLVIGLAALVAGQIGLITAFWMSALAIGVIFTGAGSVMAWHHARRMGMQERPGAEPADTHDNGAARAFTHHKDRGFHA